MPDVWVVNSSPVIVLAKAGYLHLLLELADELILPEAVATEVLAGPAADPARQALFGGWGSRQKPMAVAPELLEWALGPGETAVLALARERAPAAAILDDHRRRSFHRGFAFAAFSSSALCTRATSPM